MVPSALPFDTAGGDPPAKPCPICGKTAKADHSPFCSRRCADVDLHRWLGGVYAVPADEPGEATLPDGEE